MPPTRVTCFEECRPSSETQTRVAETRRVEATGPRRCRQRGTSRRRGSKMHRLLSREAVLLVHFFRQKWRTFIAIAGCPCFCACAPSFSGPIPRSPPFLRSPMPSPPWLLSESLDGSSALKAFAVASCGKKKDKETIAGVVYHRSSAPRADGQNALFRERSDGGTESVILAASRSPRGHEDITPDDAEAHAPASRVRLSPRSLSRRELLRTREPWG